MTAKKTKAKTKADPKPRASTKMDAQIYVLKKRDFDGVKGQRLQILSTLKDQGGKASRKDLLTALADGKTKQKPAKILAFYKGQLIKDGFVEVKTAA